MKHFDILSKLDPDVIAHFLETGSSSGIPEDTQRWIKEIQISYEVYNGVNDTRGERNISKAAVEVRKRIIAELKVNKISVRTCQERIYDAIRYFHVDNSIPDRVWNTDFANKYEELSTKAEKGEDYRTAKACLDAARECRERAREAAGLDAEFAPVFLISNDISIIDAGFKSKNLKEIARKHLDGFYLKLIDDLPTDKENKERLKIDANLPITPAEEIESD